MNNRIWRCRTLALSMTLIFLAGIAPLAAPITSARDAVGMLTVTGMVKINGQPAATGDIVASGSDVQTAKGSSAVVSLGKLGRVEAHAESAMKLSYTDSGIMVSMLSAGRVRFSTSSGVSAQATTNDGEVVATGPSENEFTVDTSCGNTFVAVKQGRVELRAGNSVKQIAAGSQDGAGTAKQGCAPGRR